MRDVEFFAFHTIFLFFPITLELEEAILPDILINMKGEIVFLFEYSLPNEIWSIVIDMVYPAYPPSSYPVLNRVCKAWYQIIERKWEKVIKNLFLYPKRSMSISLSFYIIISIIIIMILGEPLRPLLCKQPSGCPPLHQEEERRDPLLLREVLSGCGNPHVFIPIKSSI